MRKSKFLCLVMTMIGSLGMTTPVLADTISAGEDWKVTYDGTQISTNFSSSALSNTVTSVMPGDTVSYQVTVKNEHSGDTDWYMTNDVLKTLEDGSKASGGAYTYALRYVDAAGTETVLYDSDTVGGDGEGTDLIGLHQAADSTSNYFYLDRLATGASGVVYLEIQLDGNTQTNSYQNTLASIQMNFAVENAENSVVTINNTIVQPGTPVNPDHPLNETVISGPKTGDVTWKMVLSAVAVAVGVLLIIVWGILTGKRHRAEKITLFIFSACMLLGISNVTAFATEDYDYKVTIRAAGDAVFSEENLEDAITASSGDLSVDLTEDKKILTVSGICYGEQLALEIRDIAEMPEDSKYYVQGIRISGHDESNPSFQVTKDMDYVVAYGVKGDMVAYTINYVDESGNALAESRTYYGNIGDKPVVSFHYIDGYIPQAFNLTKTLQADASKNVFDFVYTPGNLTTYIYNTTVITEETVTPDAGTPDAGTGNVNVDDGGNGAGGADADADANADNPDANANNQDANPDDDVNIPDEPVPEAVQDLVDLDDEEVPLANNGQNSADASRTANSVLITSIVIALIAAAAIAGVIIINVRRRKAVHTDTPDSEQ